ncbi:1-acyl-sn-glycerol-3-phosphate acyltransferase [Intestinibacter bartlettii]|uniref:lysophospholipid acyltransferase family protein n=1 Tax=Intestinibacter bartlettii TaxID=261299 RepID=UPI001D025E62|nr:lysophospholipid acyltransferase family protein [Intestinibacter bartlettii]MCB5744858.1 1-acyl-sn-glycerol-3-phosphate acyltransferase [Intestinibacter bartlettii]MDU2693024.1 lysophospholipid acyltransferase family protein [Intestinibacter bartlettii]MDU6823387.1 lysophospholipid acyltransferase family protein [Intestinibacter bartlettii]
MSFYNFMLKLFSIFSRTFFKFEVIGTENIPSEGNLIIAANHKSNLDPIFVASAVNKKRKMTAIAKEELFKNKILAKILNKVEIIPINRQNPGLGTIKRILKYIKNDYALVMFPEGTRSKTDDFNNAKAGLSLFATKAKADIVPCTIYSSYKLFKPAKIYFGKPISLEEYYKQKLTSEDHERISGEVMDIIKQNYYKLEKGEI